MEPLTTAVAGSNKKVHSLQQTKTSASRMKTTRAAGRASRKLNELAAMEVVRAAAPVVPRTVDVATPVPVAEELAAGVVETPAVIALAVEPEIVTAFVPVEETGVAVEPTRTNDVSAMTSLDAPQVATLAIIETEEEVEVEEEVEASAIVEEVTIVEAHFAFPVEAVTFPSTEIAQLPVSEETRGALLARTAAASPAPAAPAPHHGKRALVTVVSQLLSTLHRWTGIR